MNNLYLAGIKVLRGTNTEMPEPLIGAVASCFSASPDYQSAIKLAVAALRGQGFEFAEIVGDVTQLSTVKWDDYVSTVWPEVASALPRQSEIDDLVSTGGVFFGPFAGFER